MVEQCAKFIIRPPRSKYDPERNLLDQEFMLRSKWYRRKDVEVRNSRGEVLQCSHYMPLRSPSGKHKPLPCVIFCHGNSGSRVDGNEAALILLPLSITVFTFDFSGCGLSDGDHVTLGWNEKRDLKKVVDYLRADKNVSQIGLWGRSMGAVTSLMYGAEDPSIAGMILDSPFSDLFELMTELVGAYNISIVKYGVDSIIKKIRKFIMKKENFDIMDLNTIKAAKLCNVPVLLGHATGDNFIRPHHSDRIFKAYLGEKDIIKFDGRHNTARPQCYFDAVTKFFHKVMHSPEEEAEGYNANTMHKKFQKVEGTGTSYINSSSAMPQPLNQKCHKSNALELAKIYSESPLKDNLDNPAVVENEERMFMEAFMESLKELEMRQYDAGRISSSRSTSPEPLQKDRSNVTCRATSHSCIDLPSTFSSRDKQVLTYKDQYQDSSNWLMTTCDTPPHLIVSESTVSYSHRYSSSFDASFDKTRLIPSAVIKNPASSIMDGLIHRWDPDLFKRHDHDP